MAPAELFSCAEELHLSKEFDLLCQRSAFEFYKDFGRSRDALLFLNINTSCISESLSEKEKITALMQDDDVTNKKGIYEYVLDNEEQIGGILDEIQAS